MTGQIYPVGVIPESQVDSKTECRTKIDLFLILKREDFVRVIDRKIEY